MEKITIVFINELLSYLLKSDHAVQNYEANQLFLVTRILWNTCVLRDKNDSSHPKFTRIADFILSLDDIGACIKLGFYVSTVKHAL